MAAGAPSERRGTQRRCQKPRDTSRQDIERYMHLSSSDAAKALVMEFGHGRLILIRYDYADYSHVSTQCAPTT